MRRQWVSDREIDSFKATAPIAVQLAIELTLVSGEGLSAILDLSWKDVDRLTVSFKRIRSEIRKSKQRSPSMAEVLLTARRVKPLWPRWHVLRLEDGNELTVPEFRTLWRLYMQRWVKRGTTREAFSIEDVRRTIQKVPRQYNGQ
jgi:hypothetical protein